MSDDIVETYEPKEGDQAVLSVEELGELLRAPSEPDKWEKAEKQLQVYLAAAEVLQRLGEVKTDTTEKQMLAAQLVKSTTEAVVSVSKRTRRPRKTTTEAQSGE